MSTSQADVEGDGAIKFDVPLRDRSGGVCFSGPVRRKSKRTPSNRIKESALSEKDESAEAASEAAESVVLRQRKRRSNLHLNSVSMPGSVTKAVLVEKAEEEEERTLDASSTRHKIMNKIVGLSMATSSLSDSKESKSPRMSKSPRLSKVSWFQFFLSAKLTPTSGAWSFPQRRQHSLR